MAHSDSGEFVMVVSGGEGTFTFDGVTVNINNVVVVVDITGQPDVLIRRVDKARGRS